MLRAVTATLVLVTSAPLAVVSSPPAESALASVTAVGNAVTMSPDEHRVRDYFSIPRAAYRNELGDFPADGPCTTFDSGDGRCTGAPSQPAPFSNANPSSQPGLGVPLGGVGAGSFMINQAGSFGPWNFGGAGQGNYENRILPGAAFHVREQVAGGEAQTRTLATRSEPWADLPAAWHTLEAGEGTYAALYPFGWTTYTPFATDVSMRFWSPIVQGDDRLSSMPVAFFDVRLANHTRQRTDVSVMFTMPNALAKIGPYFENPPVTPAQPMVRTGLSTRHVRDRATGVEGLSMESHGEDSTPDARDSDWVIAARPRHGTRLSYASSWDASGDGGDVYKPFEASGRLPDRALDASRSAGAIAVSTVLRPGQVRVIPFVLAWDFPRVSPPSDLGSVTSDDLFMRRYTSYFGARENSQNDYVDGSYRPHRGFAIADELLSRRSRAMRAVQRWWSPLVHQSAYPERILRNALNELGPMVFSSTFWESGRIRQSDSPADRTGSQVPGTHLYCTLTGGGYKDCNEWDTDAYGYRADTVLLPSLERGKLLARLDSQRLQLDALGPAESAGHKNFQDDWTKTIFRSWSYYLQTGDRDFLRYAYPLLLRFARYLQAGIKPGDNFPTDYPGQSSTYDLVEVVGHGVYNSSLWILTLEIMERATHEAGGLGVDAATPAVEQEWADAIAPARQQFENMFWDPVSSHYKIDVPGSYGNGYFIDTFYAQHIATTLGLPGIFNDDHMAQHMSQAFPLFMQIKDENDQYVGPPLVVTQAGTIFPKPCAEVCEVWQGSANSAAAAYISEGRRMAQPDLVEMGLTIADAMAYQTTDNVSNGFLFGAPEGWYAEGTETYRSPNFNRSRVGMDVLESLAPFPWSPRGSRT